MARASLDAAAICEHFRAPKRWLEERLLEDDDGASDIEDTLWRDDLIELGLVLGVSVPSDVLAAAAACEKWRAGMCDVETGAPLLRSEVLASARSAQEELDLILGAAATRLDPKSLEVARRHLGWGCVPSTQKELAAEMGIYRTRVSQLVQGALWRIRGVLGPRRPPILCALHHRVSRSIGVSWAALEVELSNALGGAPLRFAVEVLELLMDVDVSIATNTSCRTVALKRKQPVRSPIVARARFVESVRSAIPETLSLRELPSQLVGLQVRHATLGVVGAITVDPDNVLRAVGAGSAESSDPARDPFEEQRMAELNRVLIALAPPLADFGGTSDERAWALRALVKRMASARTDEWFSVRPNTVRVYCMRCLHPVAHLVFAQVRDEADFRDVVREVWETLESRRLPSVLVSADSAVPAALIVDIMTREPGSGVLSQPELLDSRSIAGLYERISIAPLWPADVTLSFSRAQRTTTREFLERVIVPWRDEHGCGE